MQAVAPWPIINGIYIDIFKVKLLIYQITKTVYSHLIDSNIVRFTIVALMFPLTEFFLKQTLVLCVTLSIATCGFCW